MNMNIEEIKNVEHNSEDLGLFVIYTNGEDTVTYVSEKYKSRVNITE